MAVFLLASIIAMASGAAALSTALAKKAPERSVRLPIVDGNAYVNLGADSLSFGGGKEGRGIDELASRALQTFRSEPTNSKAISLLATSRQLRGDTEGARRLYADALMLSQRDRLANLALTEDASQRGQIAFILDRYDVLLRTGGATSDTLFDVLGSAMREEAIVPHLEAILAKRPPWAQQFWLKVTPREEAIQNVGKLRLRLLSRGIQNPARNDADIVRRLAGDGHLGLAYRLFRGASGRKGAGPALLRNATFEDVPEFVPFDWVTYSDARYSTAVDPVIGALVVFIETSSDTLIAKQLVRLPSGLYTVGLRTQSAEATRSTHFSLRIRCADSSQTAAGQEASVELGNGSRRVEYPADCAFSWIELWARLDAKSPSSVPADVIIKALDFAPAGRGALSQIVPAKTLPTAQLGR